MESKYKSLSLFEFQKLFPDDESCYQYLVKMKWENGFTCSSCGHTKYCAGNSAHCRQCTKCRKMESATSDTLFHKLKFPILKAFYIVYYLSTNKKGITSTELSRKLELRQKTCWLFKQKVMKAMESSMQFPLTAEVEVDETYVGGQDETAIGRNEGKKKIVVFAVEKNGRGVTRLYGRVIKTASKKNLQSFMKDHIAPEANVKTDKWSGYKGLEEHFPNLIQEKSESKGKNFYAMHRCIMMFKAWLRGMHHSVRHLQSYINEYTYRFNRHFMKEGIFENLIHRMVKGDPHPYKMIIN